MKTTLLFSALALASLAAATPMYSKRVVANGLSQPRGIAVTGNFAHRTLFFTQVPTPGVPGSMGGRNTVDRLTLTPGLGGPRLQNLTRGEPEPTNLAFDGKRTLYWTCRSAGVILSRDLPTGTTSPFLTQLAKPTGIGVDVDGAVYFTQVPTPGVNGPSGGGNTVDVFLFGKQFNLTRGEPEPTDIVVGEDGEAFWTCRSAGVVLRRNRFGVTSLLMAGLAKPTGIAISANGKSLYWTEVPTPGVPGSMGGMNRVVRYDLSTNDLTVVDQGDPEPTDIAVAADGTLYWTCTSAGVIVEARPR